MTRPLLPNVAQQLHTKERAIKPVKGEVCTQHIRCGKPECRCNRGELHGPYFYLIWREGERVRKFYVKAADVDYVLSCCDVYRDYARAPRDTRTNRRKLATGINREWRACQRLTGTVF